MSFLANHRRRSMVFTLDDAQTIIAPGLAFVGLSIADNAGKVQINSAGAHELTAPNAVGYDVYVSWAGGTGVDGFYTILTIDDLDSLTIDLAYDAGLGVPTVALINTKVELGRLTIPARALAVSGSYYEMVSHWGAAAGAAGTNRIVHNGTSDGDFIALNWAGGTIELTVLQHGFTTGASGNQRRLSTGSLAIGGSSTSVGTAISIPDVDAETNILFSVTPVVVNKYTEFERAIFRVTKP